MKRFFVLLCGLGTSSCPLLADEVAASETFVLPALHVTGSRLYVTDVESTLPSFSVGLGLDAERGAIGPSQSLVRIPAAIGAGASENESNGGFGQRKIALRGLGEHLTLTTINGRRAGPFEDIALLPLAGLAAVDVLKESGVSSYGSDAFAGVVNFRYLPRYTGTDASLLAGITTKQDGETIRAGLAQGLPLGSGSAIVALEYQSMDTIWAADRPNTGTDLRPFGGYNGSLASRPGIIMAGSELLTLANPGRAPTSLDDYRPLVPEDLYNYREVTAAIPAQERVSALIAGEGTVTERLDVFYELLISETVTDNGRTAVPLSGLFASSPYHGLFQSSVPLSPNYRAFELGERMTEQTNDAYRVLGGIRLDLAGGTLESAILSSQGRTTQKTDASVSVTPFLNEVVLGRFNPFAPAFSSGTTSIGGTAYTWDNERALRNSEVVTEDWITTELKLWDAVYERSFETGFGRFTAAAGAELRREVFEVGADDLVRNGRSIGYITLTPFYSHDDISAVFAEALASFEVTWAREVHLSVAARHERHAASGTNPVSLRESTIRIESDDYRIGVGASWEHISFLASYATAFRAPGPQQLFAGATKLYAPLSDPLNPETAGTMHAITTRGNPDLRPETGDTFNAGFVITPFKEKPLQLGIDYFRLRRNDAIGAGAQYILNVNAATQGAAYPLSGQGRIIYDPLATYAELITRNTNGQLPSYVEGDAVFAPVMNIADITVEGLDFSVSTEFETGVGRIGLDAVATYYLRWSQSSLDGALVEERVGSFGDRYMDPMSPGSTPRFKSLASVSYEPMEDWTFSLTHEYISSLDDDPRRLATLSSRETGEWSVFHLTGAHQMGNYRLLLGVQNLFDQAPPVSVAAYNDNYDTHLYSIRGRFLYVELSARW